MNPLSFFSRYFFLVVFSVTKKPSAEQQSTSYLHHNGIVSYFWMEIENSIFKLIIVDVALQCVSSLKNYVGYKRIIWKTSVVKHRHETWTDVQNHTVQFMF